MDVIHYFFKINSAVLNYKCGLGLKSWRQVILKKRFKVVKFDKYSIGRSNKTQIFEQESGIHAWSRHHAELRHAEGNWLSTKHKSNVKKTIALITSN